MDSGLMVFPLPLLTFLLSGLICLFVMRLDLGSALARSMFGLFFALLAVESLLVALRFGYGINGLIPVQRTLPLFVGPVLYLAFAVLVPPKRPRNLIASHLMTAATLAVLVPFISGDWVKIDLVIGLSYLSYALALLAMWHKGPNHLSRARLEVTESLHKWMLWGAVFLLATLCIDTLIAVSFMLEKVSHALAVISFASLLLGAVLIAILIKISVQNATSQPVKPSTRAADEEAEKLVQSVSDLLTNTQLYLDTNLTVERLAKRLHIPVRVLSAAINQSQGMNVSQFVNGFRVRHAAHLLLSTDMSIQTIFERSGFLTRSNFYREFQRYFNQTPTDYRQKGQRMSSP